MDVTDDLAQNLMDIAREFATRAYVPYSRFPVGAAVLTEDGTIIGGVNIENASFGLTNCGERTAVFTAAALGHRTLLAVAISGTNLPNCTPCGACRQVLNEFKPETGDLVVLLDGHPEITRTTLAALLPEAFGPQDVK